MTIYRPMATSLVLVSALFMGTASAAGDAKKGEKVFNKCKTCHNLETTGPKKIGPSLAGLIGRKAGIERDFASLRGDLVSALERVQP